MDFLTIPKMENGVLMAPIPFVRPPGVTTQVTGTIINTSGPPFPETGQTITFGSLFTPDLYVYSMSCYYQGCPQGVNCQWNAPHELIVINLDAEPPPTLNLTVGTPVITPSEPTDDGNFSVKPDEPVTIRVPVSATGVASDETRNVTVAVQIGNRSLQQSIPISAIGSSSQVSFMTTFTSDDVGALSVLAVINPSGSITETTRADNSENQEMYVLCNVEDKGKEVPYFAQGGTSSWANQDYANQAPQKMRSLGCYTTSFAMLMRTYGINKSNYGEGIDPGVVNKGLNEIGFYGNLGPDFNKYIGYTSSGQVNPQGAVNYARASYIINCMASGELASECYSKGLGKISYYGRVDAGGLNA